MPGNARGRAPTMCSEAKVVEQGGVVEQELATSEEEVAGVVIIYWDMQLKVNKFVTLMVFFFKIKIASLPVRAFLEI